MPCAKSQIRMQIRSRGKTAVQVGRPSRVAAQILSALPPHRGARSWRALAGSRRKCVCRKCMSHNRPRAGGSLRPLREGGHGLEEDMGQGFRVSGRLNPRP